MLNEPTDDLNVEGNGSVAQAPAPGDQQAPRGGDDQELAPTITISAQDREAIDRVITI